MSGDRGVLPIREIVERVGGRLIGADDVPIGGVNAFDDATADEITFIGHVKFGRRWSESGAGAALVSEGVDVEPDARPLVYVDNAELSIADVLALFEPATVGPLVGIAPEAVVDPSATIEDGVAVGPHVSVGPGCIVGAGSVLYPGARLYADVTLGAGCVLHANAVVRQGCRLGRGVILHQNVSIGADGFGYRPDPKRGLVKIPHVGIVRIDDDVEIGAGSCVDRGKFGETVIGAGTKLDNLVHVGHNCRIGRCCVFASGVMLAGSVVIGDGVMMGGGCGISEHVYIGKGVKLAAMSGVMSDIDDGEAWGGVPAVHLPEMLRQWAAVRKLPRLLKRISAQAGADRGTAGPSETPSSGIAPD
jgi:UDP-3-O-[3-hydroxymyristoyl] glucosamine N-acyltransferase